jgi:hypothetical protein
MIRRLLLLIYCVCVLTAQVIEAQELITSTPVRIDIPDSAAPAVQIIATPTVTRTPTPSAVMIEAKADAGEVNVRAEADIESDRLGTIRAGEYYPVLGRYFRWIQFQYDTAPSGRGWVFDELVNIIGDESAITDLSAQPLPTTDSIAEAQTQTQIAVTLTPGGLLTVTANSRIISIEQGAGTPNSPGSGAVEVLPTFTYPPDIVAVAPTEVTITPTTAVENAPLSVPTNIPPIAPIVLLGGMGLLGLAVSSLRR